MTWHDFSLVLSGFIGWFIGQFIVGVCKDVWRGRSTPRCAEGRFFHCWHYDGEVKVIIKPSSCREPADWKGRRRKEHCCRCKTVRYEKPF